MSGTWSDERVYNSRVQQYEELYQGSEDYEDSKMSTSSSGPRGSKKVYMEPEYLQAFNVITEVIGKYALRTSERSCACVYECVYVP